MGLFGKLFAPKPPEPPRENQLRELLENEEVKAAYLGSTKK